MRELLDLLGCLTFEAYQMIFYDNEYSMPPTLQQNRLLVADKDICCDISEGIYNECCKFIENSENVLR